MQRKYLCALCYVAWDIYDGKLDSHLLRVYVQAATSKYSSDGKPLILDGFTRECLSSK